MKHWLLNLTCCLAALTCAASAEGAELCDILYNDKTPVDLGHAKVQNGRIDWTDLLGNAMTYNDPPYWVQAKIKRCAGLPTAAATPAATPLGPEAFGLKCTNEGECTVGDMKVFHHFATNAKKGDVIQFGETKDKVEFTFTPTKEPGVESKKKKGGSNKVVIQKDTWTAAIAEKARS